MKPTKTAFRYAKATWAYANENKVSDKVAKEMQGLIELYDSSIHLSRLLSNPFLPNTKKQSILRSIVPNPSDVTKKLLSLLISNNRLFLLKEVALNPKFNQSDGIHPNYEGAKLISEIIKESIINLD